MALKFASSGSPGIKVDGVNFGSDASIAGTCLIRVDEYPAASEFFAFFGDKDSDTEGMAIGVRTDGRLYFWPRMGGVNLTTFIGDADVHEVDLGKWHRVSWCIANPVEGDPVCSLWFDGETRKDATLTGYGATSPAISGWDRIAFGNRYDSTPANWIDAHIQDAAVFVGAAAAQSTTGTRQSTLWNSGSHLFVYNGAASETPFANYRFDGVAGTVTVGDAALADQQGNYDIDNVTAFGVSYADTNYEKVTQPPYFGAVRQSHYSRLMSPGTSRRVLMVGDSHMYNGTEDRFPQAVAMRWPILDWVSRTTSPRTSTGAAAGGNVIAGVAPGEAEKRPADSCFTATTNRWGLGTQYGPFAASTSSTYFTGRLRDYADGSYYEQSSGGAPQWFNGVKYAARPILFHQSGETVDTLRYKAARATSTGSFRTETMGADGWQDLPIAIGSGSVLTADSPIDCAVAGSGGYDETGDYVFVHGFQYIVLEDDNATVKPGFALDTFSPSGMDTIEHMAESSGTKWYNTADAQGFVEATRLRTDEHMILMILLSHEIGVKATIKTQYQAVIDRWRSICEDAGYSNPDIWLMGAWMIGTETVDDMVDERDMLAELQQENPDVSFVSMSAYQQHLLYDGNNGVPNYLDGSVLHWDTLAGTEFWGDEYWDLIQASIYDDAAGGGANNPSVAFRRYNLWQV